MAVSTSAPAAPINLMASAISSTQLNLNWRRSSTNEDCFKIRRKGPTDADFVEIAARQHCIHERQCEPVYDLLTG
jgi:hypothetical protein